MELRSVDELMDLLSACRGAQALPGRAARPADLHDHALRTAALLRRRRPADKELQVAGLVLAVGRLLRPGDAAAGAERAAEAVRSLLGERVHRLVRLAGAPLGTGEPDDALLALRQADEEARTDALDGGVLEDWRTVLELLATHNSRPSAVD
ncbi:MULTISPECIES: hypothetical protein [unclassified Streptomyces]|uniref:hypothetical protein n=1 Tax=unclassified Streptomyces TaxID=2593676 RepID=UPI0036F745D0